MKTPRATNGPARAPTVRPARIPGDRIGRVVIIVDTFLGQDRRVRIPTSPAHDPKGDRDSKNPS